MAESGEWADGEWAGTYLRAPFGEDAKLQQTSAGRARITWHWPDADRERRYGETVLQLDLALLERLRSATPEASVRLGESIRLALIRLVSTRDLRHPVGEPVVIDIDEPFIGE